MGMDKDDLKSAMWKKKYQKELEDLRRQSVETTQIGLANQKRLIKETRKRYFDASRKFKEIVLQHSKTFGTESIMAIILEFEGSLKAAGAMKAALLELLIRKSWLKVAESMNYNSEVAPLLTYAAEAARQARLKVDEYLGTEGRFSEALPPVLIPYLAEVDDNGVLSMSLDVDNEQLLPEDKAAFVNQYSATFIDVIRRGLHAARNDNGEPLFDIDNTNPAAPIITSHDTGLPITPAEFSAFRDAVLTPGLKHYFGEDFLAQGHAPERSSPAP